MLIYIDEKCIEVTYKELLNGVPLSKLKGTKLYTFASTNTCRYHSLEDRTLIIYDISDGIVYDFINTINNDMVMYDNLAGFVANLMSYNYRVVNLELLRDIIDSDTVVRKIE